MLARGRLVGRDRRAVAGVEPPLHRRLAGQLDPRADPRLQRPRPADRRRGRQSVGGGGGAGGGMWGETGIGCGCSTPRSAARSPGCCRPRCCCSSPASGSRGARRAHRPAPGRAGALGRLAARHRGDVQLHGRDLPRLLHGRAGARRSARWSASAPGCCGGTARSLVAAVVAAAAVALTTRARLRPARPERRTSCRGCAGSCWSSAWSRRCAGRRAVAGCPRRVAAAVAAAALRRVRWPARGVRRRRPRPPRTPARSRAPVRRGGGRRRRPAAAGRRAASPPGRPAGGGTPTGGARRRRRAACSTAASPSAEVTALLQADAGAYTWVAAAVGSNSAAGLPARQRGAGDGDRRLQRQSDPSPTLAQFQQYVADGEIHYFIGGGGLRWIGGEPDRAAAGPAARSPTWVAARLHRDRRSTATTLYDLTEPAPSERRERPAAAAPARGRGAGRRPMLDVVDPGLQRGGRPRPRRCAGSASTSPRLPYSFRVTIADNASTDGTAAGRPAAGARATTRCASCTSPRRAAAGR